MSCLNHRPHSVTSLRRSCTVLPAHLGTVLAVHLGTVLPVHFNRVLPVHLGTELPVHLGMVYWYTSTALPVHIRTVLPVHLALWYTETAAANRCNTRKVFPVKFTPEQNWRTRILLRGKSDVRNFTPQAKTSRARSAPQAQNNPAEFDSK